jgi:hypothetical protein
LSLVRPVIAKRFPCRAVAFVDVRERDAMSYMNCPRCGLTIGLRAPSLMLDRCPRCLARARAAIPMYLTDDPPVNRERDDGSRDPTRDGAPVPTRPSSDESAPGNATAARSPLERTGLTSIDAAGVRLAPNATARSQAGRQAAAERSERFTTEWGA